MQRDDDLVKIGPLAEELGVTPKTIYNWVQKGRLQLKKPGFVSRTEAWGVYDFLLEKRIEISYFTSTYGIKRDAYGRFVSE
jgi:hypothetical protein